VEERENDVECWEKKKCVLSVETIVRASILKKNDFYVSKQTKITLIFLKNL